MEKQKNPNENITIVGADDVGFPASVLLAQIATANRSGNFRAALVDPGTVSSGDEGIGSVEKTSFLRVAAKYEKAVSGDKLDIGRRQEQTDFMLDSGDVRFRGLCLAV